MRSELLIVRINFLKDLEWKFQVFICLVEIDSLICPVNLRSGSFPFLDYMLQSGEM